MQIQARHQRRREGAQARFWLGVDGGGTHTRLRCTDAAGRVLGEGQAGASALGQGPAQAWQAVQAALRAAQPQGVDWADCAIGLGLSGAGSPLLAQAFLDAAPPCAALALDTDGVAALLGAHGGAAGALLIAGTGSVGEALHANGRHVRVGGWGWQIGDEGSGAWLGRQAIQHTQRALDGRDPRGPLAEAVLAHARGRAGAAPGEGEREAVLAWCAAGSQRAYADLAPLVFAQAAQDGAAEALLQAAARELDALALALDGGAALPLCLSGSVALRLQPRLAASVRARCVAPRADAQDGALHLIRNLLPPSECR